MSEIQKTYLQEKGASLLTEIFTEHLACDTITSDAKSALMAVYNELKEENIAILD